MEGMIPNNNNNSCTTRQDLEKKSRPQEQLNCPRCNSTNTKFCYYNYSLTQPRYFCKTCRRYWTEGGSLRNVPVGGGSRKNKKINNNSSLSLSLPVSAPVSSPSVAATIASSKGIIIHQNLINPNKMLQGGGHDLNHAFSMDKYHHHGFSPLPFVDNSSSSSPSSPSSLSALELLRSSMASRGLSPLAPNNHPLIPNSSSSLYPSLGFPMQEVNKVNNNNSLGFFMDHEMMGNNHRSNYDDHAQENINNGGRVLFPFGEVKQQHLSSSGGDDHHEVENNKEQEGNPSNGYWTGIIGEGSW